MVVRGGSAATGLIATSAAVAALGVAVPDRKVYWQPLVVGVTAVVRGLRSLAFRGRAILISDITVPRRYSVPAL
ncbi:exported hypothetical protein [Rhodococcus sp. RD6.2]|nr:exported hypothetical protein [Rhodococcus sp. RD6.2]